MNNATPRPVKRSVFGQISYLGPTVNNSKPQMCQPEPQDHKNASSACSSISGEKRTKFETEAASPVSSPAKEKRVYQSSTEKDPMEAELSALINSKETRIEPKLPLLPALPGKPPPIIRLTIRQSDFEIGELATPPIQRALTIELKQSDKCKTVKLRATNDELSSSSKLIGVGVSGKVEWTQKRSSLILLLSANCDHTAISCADKSLLVLHTSTGTITHTIELSHLTNFLHVQNEHLLSITTKAELRVWSLSNEQLVLRASIGRYCSTPSSEIKTVYISVGGEPLLAKADGQAFYFSKRTDAWMSLEGVTPKLLASCRAISHVVPNGLIDTLCRARSDVESATMGSDEGSRLQFPLLVHAAKEIGSSAEAQFLNAAMGGVYGS